MGCRLLACLPAFLPCDPELMTSTAAFTCPSCGFRFRVKDKFLGQIAECPADGCSQKMRLNPPPVEEPQPEVVETIEVVEEIEEVEEVASPPESEPAEVKPTTVEFSAVNPDSVISVVASPSESRRAQRALRRRATAKAPKVEVEKKPLDPRYIGFGAVMIIGIIGYVIWLFVGEEAVIETKAPAADLPPIKIEGSNEAAEDNSTDSDDNASIRPPAAFFVKLPAKPKAPSDDLKEKILPYLNKYCADCHGPDSAEAGIDVAKLRAAGNFFNERESWERVYRMINAGAMPPSDYDPRPEHSDQEAMSKILHDGLFNFDCDLVYNPGRPTVQRLNKAEYNNTIRDLFGLEITPADNFPADDVGEGFDNIGDVLSLPPLLMEKYLDAAETVANAVIDSRDYSRPIVVSPRGELLNTLPHKSSSNGFLRLYTGGEILGKFDVPVTGEYEIRAEVAAEQAGDDNARFAFVVDGKSVHENEVEGHKTPQKHQHKLQLKAGKRSVAVSFLNDETFKTGPKDRRDRNLGVKSIVLFGPIGGGTPERHKIHKRFVTAVPENAGQVKSAAAKVLAPIMQRAFRRQVTTVEVDRYAGLVKKAVEEMPTTYESGLSLALQAILVAPEFLYRLEKDPSAGQSERKLNDYEVASRLSYFLWSSMPDSELFRLATRNELTKPDVLRKQVQRMLKDEKSEALVTNFASQWLNLRNLDDVTPDTDQFKTFDDRLRNDMRRETEMLFETVMREDRNVEDLLSADFTFVNKRLAKHYGIKGVNGNKFERVALKGTNRSGVITHGSILTLTSNPARTSPVKRGKWIMENIFGEAPPPPPPDVPELEETAESSPDASLREQLAKHREDPGCAACHKVMDPLGLGLENFDAVGQWRTKDDGHKIDASGSLPTGESFDGPLEMIRIVQSRREKYFRTLTGKMLTYAIGRGVRYYDKCVVDECLKQMKPRGYRFSSLVESIVLSDPFLKRRGPEKTNNTL